MFLSQLNSASIPLSVLFDVMQTIDVEKLNLIKFSNIMQKKQTNVNESLADQNNFGGLIVLTEELFSHVIVRFESSSRLISPPKYVKVYREFTRIDCLKIVQNCLDLEQSVSLLPRVCDVVQSILSLDTLHANFNNKFIPFYY